MSAAFTQSNRVIFEHYSAKSGLIHDLIEYVLVDSDGFVWLAQANGLQQFDGFNFIKHSLNFDDPSSLSDNFITSLYEDRSGNVWVGTFSNGLERYDKKQEVFYHYRNDPNDHQTLSSNHVARGKKVMAQDRNGFLWVNTDKGLNKLDPATGEVERFYGDLSGELLYDSINHVLWIVDKDLIKFHLEDYHPVYYEIPDMMDGIPNQIHSVIMDNDGNLWVGTESGVIVFDPTEESFLSLNDYFSRNRIDVPEIFPFHLQKINSIYQDFRNHVWLGGDNFLYELNVRDGSERKFSHEPGNINSLKKGEITGIYGNQKGVFWISYLNNGISKVNISTKKFDYYSHDPNDPESLSGNTVRSVFLDSKNNLWVGTYNNGLNRLIDQQTNRMIQYRHDPGNANSISSNYITCIYVDLNERLWIGTFESGLCFADNIYSDEVLNFSRFKPEERLEIHEFTEDQFGRIWISTQSGFFIYDPCNGQFQHYGSGENQLPVVRDINIQSVYLQPPNIFWLATWNRGLCKFQVNSDSLISENIGKDSIYIFENIYDNNNLRIDNRFINILKGRNGNLWLGSNVDGLVKVTLKENIPNFKKYTKDQGAPDNSVFGLAGDKNGKIWISTGNGIGKFDTAEEHFINYHESDGLQSNVFMWDASFQSPDGKIYFGGINGMNAFYPDSIFDNQSKSRVFISKLIVQNKEVRIGETIDGKVILGKSIRYTHEITLSSRESAFSLEFIAPDNINPLENQYAYKLEGFDDTWNLTNADRRYVTYTNLDPDNYLFRVKATNSDGYWNEADTSLSIVIKPPFWKTLSAYVIYFAIFLGLLYLFQWHIQKLDRLKHNLQLEELRHEKDNELAQLKLNFFTNLSHEIRTPLMLILGPIEKILNARDTSSRIRNQLQMVDKNAKRLLKITNQLMQFRKQDFDKPKIRAAEGNIVKFVEEIALAFRQYAQSHKIEFTFNFQDKKVNIWYEREKMEIVLFNVLSNAFKFTREGFVRLFVFKRHVLDESPEISEGYSYAEFGNLPSTCRQYVEILVKDCGCGISQNHISDIFKRYYQVSQADFENLTGSGIGLEQIKKFVELHHGKIKVISKLGEGTEFRIYLPVGRDHLKDSEVDLQFKNSEHFDHYKIHSELKKEMVNSFDDSDQMSNKGGKKSEILIIDDNPDIILYLKEILKTDYTILEASDGLTGYKRARDRMPDLIISDIMMPGMDGLKVCEKLKSDINTSHIPIILLTARNSTYYQIEGLETGADDFITKPFDERTLKIKIRNLISSRKKFRELFSQEYILKPKDITLTTADEKFLEQLIQIIEENISDPDFKVERLSRAIAMSHSMIYKKLVALTDLNIVEFIKRIRLQRAAQIMSKTKMSVTEISAEVGFTDPKYFSRCFQKLFKTTPSEFLSTNNKSALIDHLELFMNK